MSEEEKVVKIEVPKEAIEIADKSFRVTLAYVSTKTFTVDAKNAEEARNKVKQEGFGRDGGSDGPEEFMTAVQDRSDLRNKPLTAQGFAEAIAQWNQAYEWLMRQATQKVSTPAPLVKQ